MTNIQKASNPVPLGKWMGRISNERDTSPCPMWSRVSIPNSSLSDAGGFCSGKHSQDKFRPTLEVLEELLLSLDRLRDGLKRELPTEATPEDISILEATCREHGSFPYHHNQLGGRKALEFRAFSGIDPPPPAETIAKMKFCFPQKNLSNNRVNPIGPDEHIPLDFLPGLEEDPDSFVILLKACYLCLTL